MKEITVQFCSGIEEEGDLYSEIMDTLEVYYESEHVGESEFEKEPDSEMCRALHLNVQSMFRDKLVSDLVEVLEEDHDCDVVVLEDDNESVVSGQCVVDVE